MKFICKLLAALLLWLFIACNASEKSTQTTSNAADSGATAQLMVVEGIVDNGTVAPPPPAECRTYRFTPPRIVKDEEVEGQGLADVKISEREDEKPFNTEDYDRIVENRFLAATQNPLSTFSIDVDEAAYSNIRRYINNGSIPPAGAVRIEEMINYFDYTYPQPTNDEPFSVNTELSECPWSPQHRLVHIGLQERDIPVQKPAQCQSGFPDRCFGVNG